jgi:hypothetical protein
VFSYIESFAVAVILSAILLFANHLSLSKSIGRRKALSAAAGCSIAYIFVNLLPEIESAAALFRQTTKAFMPYEGAHGVTLTMMAGFLFFYALNEMIPAKRAESPGSPEDFVFWAQIAGYGGYVALIGYLLVRSLAEEEISMSIYALSMGFHFLLIEFGLRDIHQEQYDRIGRYALAGFCLAGWLVGVAVDLPKTVVVLLFGFVSGGVLAVTGIVELPKGGEGRVVPFICGAVGYAAFLIICR